VWDYLTKPHRNGIDCMVEVTGTVRAGRSHIPTRQNPVCVRVLRADSRSIGIFRRMY
jgi:hypothetical protein